MSIARTRIVNSLQGAVRGTGLRGSPRTRMIFGRRFASSGGHGHAAPSSDLPWLFGAVAVTIPTVWYLWPSAAHADHGHHDSHAEHDDSHAEKDDAPEPKDEKDEGQDQSEEKADESEGDNDKADEKSDDKSDDKSGDKSDEKSESEEQTEDKEDAEGVSNKGKTQKGKQDTRKSVPDGKGGQKKRIDSALGKDLGDESVAGEAATAKSSQKGRDGDIGGKQHGFSNTPTRHSAPEDQLKEISSKGEGTPETAKSMGTVDPNRPQK